MEQMTKALRFDSSRDIQFFSLQNIQNSSVAFNQAPIQWVPGAFSPRINWSQHEAGHSPLFSTDTRTSNSTHLYVFNVYIGQLYLYLINISTD